MFLFVKVARGKFETEESKYLDNFLGFRNYDGLELCEDYLRRLAHTINENGYCKCQSTGTRYFIIKKSRTPITYDDFDYIFKG